MYKQLPKIEKNQQASPELPDILKAVEQAENLEKGRNSGYSEKFISKNTFDFSSVLETEPDLQESTIEQVSVKESYNSNKFLAGNQSGKKSFEGSEKSQYGGNSALEEKEKLITPQENFLILNNNQTHNQTLTIKQIINSENSLKFKNITFQNPFGIQINLKRKYFNKMPLICELIFSNNIQLTKTFSS